MNNECSALSEHSLGLYSDNNNKYILVYDLGGGTLDLSLLLLTNDNVLEIKETGGSMTIGGANFDE